jgi:hypothetical protein
MRPEGQDRFQGSCSAQEPTPTPTRRIGGEPEPGNVAGRQYFHPMSFASLGQPAVGPLIDRFGQASEVTLIVGAGASMEAELPSWRALITRLLKRVAEEHAGLTTPAAEQEWIRQTLAQDDLLAAGAIVQVMAKDELDVLLPEELYGPDGPNAYEPGPIAQQVAYLRECFGERLVMLTTNYDDLLERALANRGVLKRNIKSYVRRRGHDALPAGAVPVTHLHGFAGRTGQPKRLVLTEEHYHRMQTGTSWQEALVTERLRESLCLFIGTSLADPNLIRYLYGYEQAGRQHAVVFIRQGDLEGAPGEVRVAREEAVARRWERQGVEAIFVDHFADAAQILYEIGLRRHDGSDYEPVGDRASRVIRGVKEIVFKSAAPEAEFGERQILLSGWLRKNLYDLLRSAMRGADPPRDERLALALWLLGEDGRTITGWAHSDRAHQDPLTVEAVPIISASEWVAVRAVCQGVQVQLDRNSPISRWRFVRGLPLVFAEPTRLPIGCVTISSTKPGEESILTRLPAQDRAELHRGLLESIYEVFAPIPDELTYTIA